jgi:hypothetical protein
MDIGAVPSDTDPEVFEILVARWRSMTVAERVVLVDRLCIDVARFAELGIRAERPEASATEVSYELARRRYGSDLADEAYRDLLFH